MAQHLLVFLGMWRILISILTNYEFGIIKAINIRAHLTLDLIFGLVLLLSPVLFNFYDTVYLPHVILGVVEITLALITEKIVFHSVMHKHSSKEFSK